MLSLMFRENDWNGTRIYRTSVYGNIANALTVVGITRVYRLALKQLE